MFTAMTYQSGCLSLINQLKLPLSEEWIHCKSAEVVAQSIKDMIVRGAPAIGCSAAFGFHIDTTKRNPKDSWADYKSRFEVVVELMRNSRPTAVNLFYAIEKFQELSQQFSLSTPMSEVESKFGALAEHLFNDDIRTCKRIGDACLAEVGSDKVNVLTHCNTGSLATAGYGTALGMIRSLAAAGKLGHVYMDETRPYLQGARLTAFELKKDGIDASLICDSAAAHLMSKGQVDWVITGADRIAANGDAANKIGTYSLAVNAKYHNLPFYIAAPLSTFDANARTGADIPIEQRPLEEVTAVFGQQIAPEGVKALNPSFDVTPHSLITGIVTEKGVLKADYTKSINAALF
ncbi:S-methyl-5-thioribose-1-phosphate isomerase [Oligoflexaceae bacterium]|nr:S-methyl-5-thioribose-1-phosphate isomerase [Oligoflexaceae bacterium]